MKNPMNKYLLTLVMTGALALLACGPQFAPQGRQTASLTADEYALVEAINAARAQFGRKPLPLTNSMITLARSESAARAAGGGSINALRDQSGHHDLSYALGRARPGDDFGDRLVGYWLEDPTLQGLILSDARRAGIGVTPRRDGLNVAVFLASDFR